MNTDVRDLRSTITPKSDQLNSEQLLGGPLVITVSEVRAGSGDDQPVSVYYELDRARPFKPCKTMRKLLIHAWGADGTAWVGRSMELFNEPSIKFGGETVGGIRIARMSHIAKSIEVSLTSTRGKKALHKVSILKSSAELTAALAAIEAITDKASQTAAKALCKALKEPADMESALAAYNRKVESLKAAAAPKPDDTPASLLPSYLEMIAGATDSEVATLTLDEARDTLTADEHATLTEAWRAKFKQD